jgi:hypothetical protein
VVPTPQNVITSGLLSVVELDLKDPVATVRDPPYSLRERLRSSAVTRDVRVGKRRLRPSMDHPGRKPDDVTVAFAGHHDLGNVGGRTFRDSKDKQGSDPDQTTLPHCRNKIGVEVLHWTLLRL